MKKFGIVFIVYLILILSCNSLFASSKKEKSKAGGEKSSVEQTQTQQTSEGTKAEKSQNLGTSGIIPPFGFPEEKKKEIKKKISKGIIKGTIIDEMGNPLGGVEVICVDSKGQLIQKVVTDKDGNYLFKNLEKGSYSIQVTYHGFSNPVTINFKKEEKGLPPVPINMRVYEIANGMTGIRIIRAEWDVMPNTLSYRCELYKKGNPIPIQTYDDIKQNFCEFGGLEENANYQVRIYSKNKIGTSTSYAAGSVRTTNNPPPSPYGLGYTYAKNNRIDLLWRGVPVSDLAGYLLQVKKDGGHYLYYAEDGFTSNPSKAKLIPPASGNTVKFSLEKKEKNGRALIENVIPYSFRVYAVDKYGALSRPSTPLTNVVLEDTIPPSPPIDITYRFVDTNRVRVEWKSRDTDVVKYRIYYGANKNRWDGVATTSQRFYEFLVDRSKLPNGTLYVVVTAIDRAGNESGYKPLIETARLTKGEAVEENIVLSHRNLYKDYSVAIKQPSKPVKQKRVTKKIVSRKPKALIQYGYSRLASKGYVVGSGEVATITGSFSIPDGVFVKVNSGGTLVLKDAVLKAKNTLWGGIRYLSGSKGLIINSKISGAMIGVALLNLEKPFSIRGLDISHCRKAGILVSDSQAYIFYVTAHSNGIGISLENSAIQVKDSRIENNEKGIRAHNYNTIVKNTNFIGNTQYGIRLYGGGTIEKCVFRENLVGAIIEKGMGTVTITNSVFDRSTMDGLIVATSGVKIMYNEIVNSGRYGIYVREGANPSIVENDIISNSGYGVMGGGKVLRCYVAYNNGSPYIDDTERKGRLDNIFSSSSNSEIKQIYNVDYIENLLPSPLMVAQAKR